MMKVKGVGRTAKHDDVEEEAEQKTWSEESGEMGLLFLTVAMDTKKADLMRCEHFNGNTH